MIPILIDHDHTRDVGQVDKHGMVTMHDGHALTTEMLYRIFGDVGVQYEEFTVINGVHFVSKFRIVSYSKSTATPRRPADFSQLKDMGLQDEYVQYLKGEIKAGRIEL